MDIIMIGEVRQKKSVAALNSTSHQIMPTIWSNGAKLTVEKLAGEIQGLQNFKNLNNLEKEELAKSSLWNNLVTLRENQNNVLIGPLQMQLTSQEIKEAQTTVDREQALHYVKKFGGYLKYLQERFKDDEDIVAFAMVHDTYNFQYASERIRSDKKTVLTLLQYNELLAEGISDSLKEEIGNNNPKFYLRSYLFNQTLQQSLPDKSENSKIKSKI